MEDDGDGEGVSVRGLRMLEAGERGNEEGALGGGNGRFGVSVGGEDGAFVCVLGGERGHDRR